MALSRRGFLGMAGVGAASALLPVGARAGGWGSKTPKVLEIHLGGGCSHRDAMWMNDPAEWATATSPGWPSLETSTNYLGDGYIAAHPRVGVWTELPKVGTDESGREVRMGLAARGRPYNGSEGFYGSEAWSRMRLLATRGPTDSHGVAPHVAATGLLTGRNRAAGLGALAQHVAGPTYLPAAWVFDCINGVGPGSGFLATGAFGMANAPALLQMHPTVSLSKLLESRPRRPSDALLAAYATEYRDALIPSKASVPARSVGHSAYDAALARLLATPDLWQLLKGFQYYKRRSGEWWVSQKSNGGVLASGGSYENNPTLLAIQLSKYLFETGNANYCAVVDSWGGNGYDIHPAADAYQHAYLANWKLANVLDALADPAVGIDLNETLVIINTEFGRSHPSANPNWNLVQDEHHNTAWSSMVIGGPVVTPGIGGTIAGAAGPTSNNPAKGPNYAWGGFAGRGYHPAHLHAAAMQWLDAYGKGVFDPTYGFDAGDWGTVPGFAPSAGDLASLVFGT